MMAAIAKQESMSAYFRARDNPPGTPALEYSYPLRRIVSRQPGQPGWTTAGMACGHTKHITADSAGRRARCFQCPPKLWPAGSPLGDRERALAARVARERGQEAIDAEADKRPCQVCGTPASARGTFFGGPALCEGCEDRWHAELPQHPKQDVASVELEPGQEDWWAVQWWIVTLACGHSFLTKAHDPSWPWLRCWECPA